jgi:hypothetical protein
MSDLHRAAADRGPPAQLTLGLTVRLDPPTPLDSLAIGDRFLLESTGVEGRLEARGPGSATVAIWRDDVHRWTRTTWGLMTLVRRLRA